MVSKKLIYKEVKDLYKIIPLKHFRTTPGVYFDIIPKGVFTHIDGFDRVIHESSAISPGSIGNVKRPWYMHPFQEDFLIVLHGVRYTDIYTPKHGKIESFEISPNRIKKNNKIIFDGPAILSWPCHVFHRIRDKKNQGSAALNFAVRHKGFNIRTNFNIYDLDIKTGKYKLLRAGHLDQR